MSEQEKPKEDVKEESTAVGGANDEETKKEPESESGATSGSSSSSFMDMTSISDYLAQHLGIREKPPSKLESLDLAGIAKYLASEECKNVVTMAGAGISTSAGIPDFRTPGSGLYDNLASYDLPDPTAIFAIDFFRENPKPFFVLAKELYPGSFKPTPCHYFINLLNQKGKLLRHYTQNIDTLERVAGLDNEKIVEAHGTFHTGHCLQCTKEYSQDWMKDEIFADKIPKCTKEQCEGVVKPDIVFFGEALPKRFAHLVGTDLSQCDLLIVMGTSLQVQPFASLITRVPITTPRLYINLEKGMSASNPISALLFGGSFEFDADDNYRDVFKQSTCDDGCQELADLLGWGDELKQNIAKEHAKIDKSQTSTGATTSGEKAKASPEQSKPTAKSKSSTANNKNSPSASPGSKDTKGKI